MIPRVAMKWYELGNELLAESDRDKLSDIQSTHNNFQKCCLEMFHVWLTIYPNATWCTVIEVLRSPGLQLVKMANEIEKDLKGYNVCTVKECVCGEGGSEICIYAILFQFWNKFKSV